jgi:hypothetical protein
MNPDLSPKTQNLNPTQVTGLGLHTVLFLLGEFARFWRKSTLKGQILATFGVGAKRPLAKGSQTKRGHRQGFSQMV